MMHLAADAGLFVILAQVPVLDVLLHPSRSSCKEKARAQHINTKTKQADVDVLYCWARTELGNSNLHGKQGRTSKSVHSGWDLNCLQ